VAFTVWKRTGRQSVRWVRKPFSAAKTFLSRVAQVGKTQTHEWFGTACHFPPSDQYGHLPITATLINTHPIKNVPWEEISARCFFQCEMTVTAGSDTTLPPFVERRSRDTRHLDPELRHSLLLYRTRVFMQSAMLRGGLVASQQRRCRPRIRVYHLHPTARCLPAGSADGS